MLKLRPNVISFINQSYCALILNRNYAKDYRQEVRVRFAPSPTGYLHLGGLRTALYNYLYAKSKNGKFILRIEDTDQDRLVEGAAEKLCTDLAWAGIVPDEGPIQGGPYGPYVQSQRIEIYQEEVKKLIEKGDAYHCFCTERRLELLRKEALKARQVPKYDNRCRYLTPTQIAERMARNDKYCIRFKLDSAGQTFNDMVYGKMTYYIAQTEGDPVILKSDGFPTYHLANVVDDHHMKITHVLRGVEWQVSTPKHIMMYQAFGWVPPTFAHLPLIMNSDGSKLSKRQGDIRIEAFKDRGILPQALLNYITQSGGGFEREPGKINPCQMSDLTEKFNISLVNAHSSRLNPELLGECNRQEIMHQLKNPERCDMLVEQVKQMVTDKFQKDAAALDLGKEHIKNVLDWSVNRIGALNELVEGKLSFLWILPKFSNNAEINEELLESLIDSLHKEKFTKTNLQSALKDFSAKNKLTFSSFMGSLRNLLSGLKEGPGVAEMMEILGKENTIKRILRIARTKKK